MTNRIQPVAFHDVNGNLIDDEPLHQEKLIATTRRYGISLREEDFHQEHHFPIRGKNGVMFLPEKPMKLHGAGDETLYWWAVAQRKELQDILSIQDWNKELFAYYIEHAQEVKPRENMVELIEKLAADKVLQAIVTSGVPQQVEANMAVLGNAAKHMEFIMGAHDVIYRKPAPECYIVAGYRMQKIIDARYGGAQMYGIVTEDSQSGVRAALGANFDCVQYLLPGYAAASVEREQQGLLHIANTGQEVEDLMYKLYVAAGAEFSHMPLSSRPETVLPKPQTGLGLGENR